MSEFEKFMEMARAAGLNPISKGINPVALLGEPAKIPPAVADQWTESEFTDNVLHLALGNGWKAFHIRPAWTEQNGKKRMVTPVQGDGLGFPDVFAVRGSSGRVAVELKVGYRKAEPAQLAWLAALAAVGFATGVYYPSQWDELVELLR